MASSLNKVMLMGNITREIELKTTTGNQAVAKIGLAMNRKWKTPDGEQKEEVTFVDCEAWGKTAEMISQYFAKGKPILIEGRLKLDTWQDKESGGNRSKLKVVIDSFYFVDSKGGGGGASGGEDGGSSSGRSEGGWAPKQSSAPRAGAPAAAPRPAAATAEPMGEEDIPF